MKSRVLRISLWLLTGLVLLLSSIIGLAYLNQSSLVQRELNHLNDQFQGQIEVGNSQLALFENLPYVSVRVQDVRIQEHKGPHAPIILDVADIYVGFNAWDILVGTYDIRSLLLEGGLLDVVMHEDGSTNLEQALTVATEDDTESAPMDIHLKKMVFRNMEFHQREEATDLDIATRIDLAKGGFQMEDEQIRAHIDTEFVLDILSGGDTTYFNNKHIELHTDLRFDQGTGLLAFEPSGIRLEHGDFELEGSIDTKQDMTVDISVNGTKPSFDMFMAFAPTEIIPVLERYENAGKIYFNASLQGPTTEGRSPFIDAEFGASEAFLENTKAQKRIDQMGFSGHFTNGSKRDLTTMEFAMEDITAQLEEGELRGQISVVNFKEPDIDMSVDADFKLGFWADFLGLEAIEDLDGRVELHMKFHDVIDLDNPQKALEDLNQVYYAELQVEDFSLNSPSLPAPLNDLDAHLKMEGNRAELDSFRLQIGDSDISITGFLSDLPAIVHHTPIPVDAHLEIRSELMDLAELTKYSEDDSTGFNEQVKNLSMAFSFNALGNAFTEFKDLPRGEFFIDDLYADLQNYPHTLHDFHADVLVKDDDLNIIDFTGNIDSTVFHFNGLIHDYRFWMQEELNGEVDVDMTLTSELFRLEDIFSYQGVNHVPPDYRHEEIEGLELHLLSTLDYEASELQGVDVRIDQWTGKMHVHPLRFQDFSGNVHIEDEHLMVSDFKGTLGRTRFDIDMDYYLGDNEAIQKRDNQLSLRSNYIQYNELFNFQLEAPAAEEPTESEKTTEDVAAHAEAFNIFEVPFPDMRFDVSVDHFVHERYDLKDVQVQMRTTQDHYIYLDTMSLEAAGGRMAMNGYFNGSDPKHIYLKPNLRVEDVDLDQLLFKFENFGQDAVVSENLHGKLTADIWGNIRVYPDLVPDLDQSEVHLDALVLNGSLEDYEPMLLLSEYFGDKDLTSVRFDTIQNHIDFKDGLLSIPNMTIESTLGHMELSGTQDVQENIDYFIRIPWSLVKEAAKNKLFGAKRKDGASEDEIVEVDENKKVRYLNINMVGTLEDYEIKMRKPKKRKE